ncbi:hypothetical protein TRFO_04164 [Tritrichomonas foetus]|uniref:BACK domain-containing protein n=1 Tax=Tritrichomonas foetus TaxID=1144522 RepID=A0A1J4KLU4_9EUKA|nr:hypothetical protein TRFO_04164 [Tritrichomonas foetus]|eukprot:OHT10662.1 hypothetical protein TRFO_04164 [Tritrichomonas foetus]
MSNLFEFFSLSGHTRDPYSYAPHIVVNYFKHFSLSLVSRINIQNDQNHFVIFLYDNEIGFKFNHFSIVSHLATFLSFFFFFFLTKSKIEMLSVTPPLETPNFNLILRETEFPICKFQFCRYSLRFQKDPSILTSSSYQITSEVSEASLKSFIAACQDRPYFLSVDNIFEFQLLCTEFETSILFASMENFFKENEDALLLPRLLFCIEHNTDFSSLIDKIASNIDNFIDNEKLLEIPEEILCQILSSKTRNSSNEHKIFEFCKNYAIRNKKETTSLLSFINFGALSINEIRELSESKFMPNTISTPHIMPFVLSLLQRIEDQNQTIQNFRTISDNLKGTIQQGIIDVQNSVRQVEDKNKAEIESILQINTSYDKINSLFDGMKREFNDTQTRFGQTSSVLNSLKSDYEIMTNEIQKIHAFRNPLQGIFFNYRKNHQNENPATSGFVKILTPMEPNHRFKETNLLEYDQPLLDASYYLNQNLVEEQNKNWIDFDFGDKQVSLFAFGIRTNSLGETMAHPRDFEVLGSNDRENWTPLLKVENAIELSGARKTGSYACPEKSPLFRYIRYLQKDTHYMYKDRFGIISLSAIEFFGDVLPETHHTISL